MGAEDRTRIKRSIPWVVGYFSPGKGVPTPAPNPAGVLGYLGYLEVKDEVIPGIMQAVTCEP